MIYRVNTYSTNSMLTTGKQKTHAIILVNFPATYNTLF